MTFFLFVCFVFSGPHPWHMEVTRLGIESEVHVPADTTPTATPDLSLICGLHPPQLTATPDP